MNEKKPNPVAIGAFILNTRTKKKKKKSKKILRTVGDALTSI